MPRTPGTYPSPAWTAPRTVAYSTYTPSQLSANVSLVWVAPGTNEIQVRGRRIKLDPGSATRRVNLPPVTDVEGAVLGIYNTSTSKSLILQTSAGLWTGIVVPPLGYVDLFCLGQWRLSSAERLLDKWYDFELFEEFAGIPGGGALPPWLTTQDTSAAGAPTLDYAADAIGGQYRLGLAADNEVEAITLYGGNQLVVNSAKPWYFETRVTYSPDITGAGGLPAAGDKCVIGLGSDRNATLDNMVLNAWFLIGGAADLTLRVESDDGTTDVDDTSTGNTVVSGTPLILAIDALEPTAGIRFIVNGVVTNTLASVAWSGSLQLFIENAKAAAANKDHRLDVDYVRLYGCR